MACAAFLLVGGNAAAQRSVTPMESSMEEGTDGPSAEAVEVAEAGIRGMISVLKSETISPDLMIDAALHILAAWVASSQTKSSATEREEEIFELVELLPSYIDYHRSAGWLPDPRRADN